jgi:hypothetical protein
MKKILKPLVIAFNFLVICGIVWLALKWFATERLENSHEKINKGDSEAQVLKLLGTPSKISGLPENVSWDSDATLHPNKRECIKACFQNRFLSQSRMAAS